MRAPIADFFSLLPFALFDQAFHSDFALFPTPNGEVWLAYWVRVAKVAPEDGALTTGDGAAFGHELVAYPCDETGRVLNWERRYEVETTGEGAEIVRKLRALLANGLARLSNYEGHLDEVEACADQIYALDWGQMPKHIQ